MPPKMPARLVPICAFALLILAVIDLHGAEYKAAEMTPPRSVDDFDRANQKAWRASLGDIKETDFTLDYKPGHDHWDGLWFRVRYARLREDGSGEVANQLRIILKYNFQIL
jgi:hypothetical protein